MAMALVALLALITVIGFAIRYRRRGEDLDSWLALAATLTLFAELNYVLSPHASTEFVSQGDFLRLLSYGVLMVGVWRAIRFAELGRAVAEERARVAREIHDGLAQYLFAVSTHATMLEAGTAPDEAIPKLKAAAAAPSRRPSSPCSRSPRRAARRRSTPRCAATSSSSRPTAHWTSTSRSTPARCSRPTSRSRSSGSSRRASRTSASTRAHGMPRSGSASGSAAGS